MKKNNKFDHTKTNTTREPARKPVDAAAAPKPFVPLTRKNVLELRIASLDEDGYGTARSEEGMTLKVGGALPGDVVLAGIDHVAGGTAFCHVKKLLQPSLLRSNNPPCRESADCFGCPLIAMKYSEQKNWKRGMVLAEMAKYPGLSGITVHPLLTPDNLIHYRTTAKLTVAGKFSEPFIGIYRRASHDVYDLDQCPIHHPLIDKVVEAVRRGIKKGKVQVYNPQSKMGLLRYLVVRVSTHEKKAMVVFVTSKRSYNEIHHLGRFVQDQVPEVEIVVQNVNSTEGNVIMGQKDFFGEWPIQIAHVKVAHDGILILYYVIRENHHVAIQAALFDRKNPKKLLKAYKEPVWEAPSDWTQKHSYPVGIVEMRELFMDLSANHGITIFISSHILGEISRLATRIGIIHEGRRVQEIDA